MLIIDLVGRLETKDKIAQIGHSAPGVDSLKIPAYQWWSEALHGVAGSPGVHFGGNVWKTS
jgi:pre-mRNA-splicing factor SYF2/beta-D-xylosidase 4